MQSSRGEPDTEPLREPLIGVSHGDTCIAILLHNGAPSRGEVHIFASRGESPVCEELIELCRVAPTTPPLPLSCPELEDEDELGELGELRPLAGERARASVTDVSSEVPMLHPLAIAAPAPAASPALATPHELTSPAADVLLQEATSTGASETAGAVQPL